MDDDAVEDIFCFLNFECIIKFEFELLLIVFVFLYVVLEPLQSQDKVFGKLVDPMPFC